MTGCARYAPCKDSSERLHAEDLAMHRTWICLVVAGFVFAFIGSVYAGGCDDRCELERLQRQLDLLKNRVRNTTPKRVVITASGTSRGLKTSDDQHQRSAFARFRTDASQKCRARGFVNWRNLGGNCSPSLFGVPCYSYSARVHCY